MAWTNLNAPSTDIPSPTPPTPPKYGGPHAPLPPPFVFNHFDLNPSNRVTAFRQAQASLVPVQAFLSSPQLALPLQALPPTQWPPSHWKQGSRLTSIPSPVQSPYTPFTFSPQPPPPPFVLSSKPQHPSTPIPIPTPTPRPGLSPTFPNSLTYRTPGPSPLPPCAPTQNVVHAPGPPVPPTRSRSTQQRQLSIPDDLPPVYDGPGMEEELTAERVNLLLDGIESQVGQKNSGSVQITSVSFADFITYIPVVLGQPRDTEPMDRVKPAHASYNAMYVEKIDGLSGLDELDIELQSSYEGKVRR